MPEANDGGHRFAASLASVAAARRVVRAALVDAGVSEPTVGDAALLVSELVTNAVVHARTEVTVRYRIEDSYVRFEVGDGDTRIPTVTAAAPDATSGRGLALVASHARAWGAERAGPGKVVWFELTRAET